MNSILRWGDPGLGASEQLGKAQGLGERQSHRARDVVIPVDTMSQFAISLQGSTCLRLSIVRVGAIDMDRGANMLLLRRDHDAVLSAEGREHEALLLRDIERGLSFA